MLTVISRRLVDPILTRLGEDTDGRLLALLRHGRNLGAAAAAAICAAAAATYPWYATLVGTPRLGTRAQMAC